MTTSEIRQTDIVAFVDDVASKPALKVKLDQVVESTLDVIEQAWPEKTTSREEVCERSLTLLRQIAECESLPRRVIDAELSREIAFQCADRDLVETARKKLLGSLLQETAQGVEHSHGYDLGWVEGQSGLRFSMTSTLDESVASACNQQVARRLPPNFSSDLCSTRAVTGLLDDFIRSEAPLFILTGRSGSGKSWLVANWTQKAHGRARVLIPGYAIVEAASLIPVLANEFRTAETVAVDDHVITAKLLGASRSKEFGPMVVVIDDICPSHGQSQAFARNLAVIVQQARTFGVKLVVTCHAATIRTLRPFASLQSKDVFHADPRVAQEKKVTPSCVLDDFTADELRDALSRRVSPEQVDRVAAHLLDPSFVAVRNPYLLDSLIEDLPDKTADALFRVGNCDIASLFDHRLESLLEASSAICSLNPAELRRVLASLARLLRVADSSVPTEQVYREIEGEFASLGKEALDAFVTAGVVVRDDLLTISDSRVAARLTSAELASECAEISDLVRQLDVGTDHDVVVQLICSIDDSVDVANALVDSDLKWLPAVAEGLALCDGREAAVEASLVGFARRKPENQSVLSALGRYALRSRYAWKQLVRRFLSTNDSEQRIAEHAMWHVASMSPDNTVKAIRLRLRLTKGPDSPFTQQKEQRIYRNQLARAIRPMSSINDRYATERVLALLQDVKTVCEAPLQYGDDKAKLEVILTDPLVREYSELQLLATAYADESAFSGLLQDATTHDVVARARVVTALDVVAYRFPQRVIDTVRRSIQTESDPTLLARTTWAAANVARANPAAILDAIEANTAACWQTYESAATTLSLLELVSSDIPLRVLEVLPTHWTEWPDESYWLVRELVSLCRYKCRDCIGGADATPSVLRGDEPRIGPLVELSVLHAERAGVVDAVLAIAIDLGLDDGPLISRAAFRHSGPDFFKVGLATWVAAHSDEFAGHRWARQLQDKIVTAAMAGRECQAHVLDAWRGNIRFWLVLDCLEILVTLLKANRMPESIVATLPPDWEQLYVARRLLEQGCASPGLIDLAISACESKRNSATAQASSERTECLIALQRIVPDRVPAPRDEQNGLSLAFGGEGVGVRLIAQLDENPSTMVSQLECELQTSADGMLLENWHALATTWSTILVSRAYSRMFQLRRIRWPEAVSLCDSMLLGLGAAEANDAAR